MAKLSISNDGDTCISYFQDQRPRLLTETNQIPCNEQPESRISECGLAVFHIEILAIPFELQEASAQARVDKAGESATLEAGAGFHDCHG